MHLEYSLIRSHPKIFCGYSDITLLHHAIFTHLSLQTFYGPIAVAEFGQYPIPFTFTSENFFYVVQESAGKLFDSVTRSSSWTEGMPGLFVGRETPSVRKYYPVTELEVAMRWCRNGYDLRWLLTIDSRNPMGEKTEG